MIIKAWNRQGLRDGYKAEERLEHIASILSMGFGVKTKSFGVQHKKTLHNMSQGIVTEVYKNCLLYTSVSSLVMNTQVAERLRDALNDLLGDESEE